MISLSRYREPSASFTIRWISSLAEYERREGDDDVVAPQLVVLGDPDHVGGAGPRIGILDEDREGADRSRTLPIRLRPSGNFAIVEI